MKAFSFVPTKDNPLQIDIIIEESLKFETLNKNKITSQIPCGHRTSATLEARQHQRKIGLAFRCVLFWQAQTI